MIRRILAFLMLLPSPDATALDPAQAAEIVEAHNAARGRAGVETTLRWSDELAEVARQWAVHLAEDEACRLVHRPRQGPRARPYGENLYWASPQVWTSGSRRTREVQAIGAAQVAEAWASEAKDYSAADNRCRPGKVCGHYTQMIWSRTRSIGCARTICDDKGQIWVCNYDPPGNIIGRSPF